MAYCTSTDVRQYLGISSTGDDTLITALIARATAQIEMHTHRDFEASSATRRFVVGEDTEGDTLYFDEDIVSITTVTTDADAASPTTISSTEYVTLPRNRTPYYGIKILASADKSWDYTDDPEMGITVAGKWGYSTAPPADIKNAAIRLSAFLYRLKDAQVFDVQAIPEAGVITVPQGIPKDVQLILEPYVKRF